MSMFIYFVHTVEQSQLYIANSIMGHDLNQAPHNVDTPGSHDIQKL